MIDRDSAGRALSGLARSLERSQVFSPYRPPPSVANLRIQAHLKDLRILVSTDAGNRLAPLAAIYAELPVESAYPRGQSYAHL
jgi:hypothetical protein